MKIEEWCDEEGIKQFIHVLDPRDHNLALPYLALYLIVSFLACVGCGELMLDALFIAPFFNLHILELGAVVTPDLHNRGVVL